MSPLQFRLDLAESLIKEGINPLDIASPGKRKVPKNAYTKGTTDDVRFDGIGHWPNWTDNRERCKLCPEKKLLPIPTPHALNATSIYVTLAAATALWTTTEDINLQMHSLILFIVI